MRLLDLRLIAYGPFTDARIPLDEGAEGLHVVFGPNEAGKSSALRAIDAALFGIPGQTPDNFLHNYQDLSIGAALRRADGRRIEFIRRKGNARTLRAPSGDEALPDDALAPFLRGVDQGAFRSMFGLNRDALVAGGREVVAGKGRLGELLFAAGSGLSGVRRTLDSLRADVAALYAPRAQKPPINHSLSRIKRLRDDLKSTQVQSHEWVRLNQQYQQALAERDKVDGELRQRRLELQRRTRIHNLLPLASRRETLRQTLDRLAGTPLLTKDFSEHRRSAETERDGGLKQLQELEREIQSIEETLAQPPADASLVEHAEAVEDLNKKLSEHLKALHDLPAIQDEERKYAEEARRLLSDLRAGDDGAKAEFLGLSPVEAARVDDLASRYERLSSDRDRRVEELERLKSEIESCRENRAALGPVVDVSELRAVLDDLTPQGDLEARLADMCRHIQAEREEFVQIIARAGVWSGEPEELENLPLPDMADVDQFDQLRRQKLDHADRIRQEVERMRQKVRDVEAQLQTFDQADAVPTEEQLAAARRLRDVGLRCVKRALADGAEPAEAADFVARFPAALSLGDAFERSLLQADELADRMRRDADALARRRNAEVERNALAQELVRAEESLRNVKDEIAETEERWRELWAPSGVAPRTPREMKKWLQTAAQLSDRLPRHRADRVEADRLEGRIVAAREMLAARLRVHGVQAPAALAQALALADRFVEQVGDRNWRIETLEQSIEALDAKLRKAEASLRVAEGKLNEWQNEWSAATATLGLDRAVNPAEARTAIRMMHDAAHQVDLQRDRRKRIDAIDRDAEKFRRRVAEVCERLAPDLRDRPAEAAAEELYRRLGQARQAQALRNQRRDAYQALLAKRARLSQTVDDACVRLQGLCREAGCERPDQLAAREARSEELRDARRQFDEVQEQLRAVAAGEELDALLLEARSVSPDETEVAIARLKDLTDELATMKSQLDEQVGELRTRLRAFEGEAKAAYLREDVEAERAALQGLAGRYVRLRLAEILLDEAVRRYREENEAPVLRRAGEFFADLTLGSFTGLSVDFNDDGQPVLIGVRGDSRSIRVEGMSEGTADQLYLALRLAALDVYLDDEANEPMPLILDDVFVNFDDDRARAALKILEEFSRRTQIVFFTHHSRLVELAQAALQPENLFVHEISPTHRPLPRAASAARET